MFVSALFIIVKNWKILHVKGESGLIKVMMYTAVTNYLKDCGNMDVSVISK